MLNDSDFRHVIKNAPLFSIDLIVLNERRELLFGLRKNEPASGFWFVPGGRVFKNEPLVKAYHRISLAELGASFKMENFTSLGLFEHFYENSFVDELISTHYINTACLLIINSQQLKLPLEQHEDYRWVVVDSIESDKSIHHYSKVFLPSLLAKMANLSQ
ncbi:GDP-mannose mannosyl hydrolase [Paraglaciecola sp.]|uniref:GDP-mannose mannosyl hydrolase n=1 Tax=Paraglaciecola sp. TaxID=1920173 RepID=UPI00273D805C|nr:GDP-mannose mannosyl hydrolase [Paraglaciecola sp.]MDP5029039.1 GDP-mannose mannosyl hydrolase [Paraglaciecola sp.]